MSEGLKAENSDTESQRSEDSRRETKELTGRSVSYRPIIDYLIKILKCGLA